MNNPRVSIVIPVFNKADLTLQCLKALKGSTKVPYEIIVVDNASTDSTQHDLRSLYPPGDDAWNNFTYLRNEVNLNFSGACNQGAKVAKGATIVFLNNDTIPFTGWLEPLVAELDENKDVTIVGAKLLYPDNTIQHAGVAFMRETRFPYHPYSHFSADHPGANHRRELQVVTGACLAIRKDDFFRAGQFNEEYKNGGEDIELCLKVRERGGKVVYTPESVLIHLESQSPGRMDANDANVKVFFKNFPDTLLSDEDAFYYEDGLYRTKRIQVERIELNKLASPEMRAQYKHLADLQLAMARKNVIDLKFATVPVTDWPADADVHEWVALVANKIGDHKTASAHFKEALMLQKLNIRNRALGEINSAVFLNPHFNKYFANEN